MKYQHLLFAIGLVASLAMIGCDDDEPSSPGDADTTSDTGDGGSDVRVDPIPDVVPDGLPDAEPDAVPDAEPDADVVEDLQDEDLSEPVSLQVDRMGRPGVNTVLIPAADKNDYNQVEDPAEWADFTAAIRTSLVTVDGLDANSTNAIHGGVAATLDLVAGVLTDDRIRIDTEYGFFACGYLGVELDILSGNDPGTSGCGGRRLQDDIIDATFGALIGSTSGVPTVSDNVDANDCAFPTAFPFLASANCHSGQVDRMGRPGVNTVLVASGFKDAYNQLDSPADWSQFTAMLTANVAAVDGLDANTTNAIHGGVPATIGLVAGVLTDDRIRIDTEYGFFVCGYLGVELDILSGNSPGTSGCGGRRLQDDVIDATFGALIGNTLGVPTVSDNVDANDCAFGADFPFLAGLNTAGVCVP